MAVLASGIWSVWRPDRGPSRVVLLVAGAFERKDGDQLALPGNSRCDWCYSRVGNAVGWVVVMLLSFWTPPNKRLKLPGAQK